MNNLAKKYCTYIDVICMHKKSMSLLTLPLLTRLFFLMFTYILSKIFGKKSYINNSRDALRVIYSFVVEKLKIAISNYFNFS